MKKLLFTCLVAICGLVTMNAKAQDQKYYVECLANSTGSCDLTTSYLTVRNNNTGAAQNVMIAMWYDDGKGGSAYFTSSTVTIAKGSTTNVYFPSSSYTYTYDPRSGTTPILISFGLYAVN